MTYWELLNTATCQDDVAEKMDSKNELTFWAGNMAIHVFNRSFLNRLTEGNTSLPFHIAHKKMACLDAAGNFVDPENANAFKFEKFIFDALEFANKPLVVEANRIAEFNPVKNSDGNDSPETARKALTALHHDWLTRAGVTLSDDSVIEISPLFAHNAQRVQERIAEIEIPQSGTLYLQ